MVNKNSNLEFSKKTFLVSTSFEDHLSMEAKEKRIVIVGLQFLLTEISNTQHC